MRGPTSWGFPPLTPAVKRLLIVLAAVFAAQVTWAAAGAASYQSVVPAWLALRAEGVLSGRVWQLATYMWLHSIDGWGHLLSNGIGLYFLGTAVEERIGTRGFWRLAVGAGLAGGVAVLLVQGVGIALELRGGRPVVGFSGAVSGVLGAYCYLFWDRWLYLFFIRLQGKHLLALFLFVEAVRVVQSALGSGNVAVDCHLGGLVWGLLWITGYHHPKRAWLALRHWRAKRRLRLVHSKDDDERPALLN